MDLVADLERVSREIEETFEERIQSLRRLKKQVHDELARLRLEFEEMASDLTDSVTAEMKGKKREIGDMLQQFQEELDEVRQEIQEVQDRHRLQLSRQLEKPKE